MQSHNIAKDVQKTFTAKNCCARQKTDVDTVLIEGNLSNC